MLIYLTGQLIFYGLHKLLNYEVFLNDISILTFSEYTE